MWDYSFVFPSLLVLAVFIGYYFSLPRIPIRMNRTFIYLIIIESMVMILDIVSSYVDMNYQEYPIWLIYFLNSAYFVMFLARGHYFFVFSGSALRLEIINNRIKRTILALPFVISVLIVATTQFTKWFYYIDGTGYHSAPLYYLLYFEFWFYLALSFAGVFSRKDFIMRKREYQIIFWYNVILLAGTIARLMFPSYLLMDTFCLISLICIYLSFENPDFYMEGRTWLFNNRALREYLEEINGRKKFTIFAFSIKNYRDVRDKYGLKQMEQGICLMGMYLKREFPKQKIFYCQSGRFAILFEEECDRYVVCKKLEERFKDSWTADDAELYVDICCAYMDPAGEKLPKNLIPALIIDSFNEADKSDRDEIRVVGREFIDKAYRKSEIKKAVGNAIANNLVEVYLQPIVDAKTEKLVGAEALARIRDSEGKIIPPDEFIAIAEQNGQINDLGHQVFEKTCRFIRDYNMEKLGLNWINVNLSPIQFMRNNLSEDLMNCLVQYGISPKFIHLEVTEEVMVDEQLLASQANNINLLGFHFVLDDYGKGYSNMSRLKKCPFINIKLDMSIVRDYCDNPDEMLPSMISAFTKVGFGTTAEGIETSEMARKMAEIGCTYLQGYHYSKPLPMDEFVAKYGC